MKNYKGGAGRPQQKRDGASGFATRARGGSSYFITEIGTYLKGHVHG